MIIMYSSLFYCYTFFHTIYYIYLILPLCKLIFNIDLSFSAFFTLHFFTNKIGCYNVFNISILVKFFTLISIYNNIKLGGIMKKEK